MSMSTHVVGIIPADKQYEKMRKAYNSCLDAGIPLPRELEDFFGGEEPELDGMSIELSSNEWSDGNTREGLEVDLRIIPKSVMIIRFYNAW